MTKKLAKTFDRKEIKMPKYDIKVQLTGENGNALSIMGRVSRALKKAGASKEDVKLFRDEARSGDYDKLLRTCMDWVDVE